jgi:pilus assembly protein CpaF
MSTQRSTDFAFAAAAPLRRFLDDPAVTEVMVNGPAAVFVERHGERPQRVDTTLTRVQIDGLVANIASLSHKVVSLDGGHAAKNLARHSVISARLPGFRLEVQMPPVAVHGPYITIRRHNVRALTLQDYVQKGQIPAAAAEHLAKAVASRENILVAGGTSSGKTTFLNALIQEVDRGERLLTIEVVAELIVGHENTIRLEADDEQGYPVQRLLKSALRSRPDRIIVGEVRGGEAFDWLDAANTGHPGTLASLHANSAAEALARLENLVQEGRPVMPLQAIKQRIGDTLDLVVHMHRINEGGQEVRRLSALVQVDGFDPSNNQYRLNKIF